MRSAHRSFGLGFAVGALAVLGSALLSPSARVAMKGGLIRTDQTVFGGALRRVYHGQSLPVSPPVPVQPGSYAWLREASFLPIAHALGPGYLAAPNTVRTFEHGYEAGFRVFEVDLALTADGHLVCLHDGGGRNLDSITRAQYQDDLLSQQIEPCEFSDLLRIADSLPDVRFVIDAKNRFAELYEAIRSHPGGQSHLGSFIPQIFEFEQAAQVRRDQHFAGEIFTSYRSALTTDQIFTYARMFDVKAVTLSRERARALRDQLPADIAVFTHPVETPGEAVGFRRLGFRGIYTSSLAPANHPLLYARWIERCTSEHVEPCVHSGESFGAR
jgi:glycerophosphoryl diester phosphodiesterase